MQTLGQLHNTLSYMIGDPIVVPNNGNYNTIPDGVRYSRELRTSYLQRALDENIGEVVQQLVSAPYDVRSQVVHLLFPLTLKRISIPLNYDTTLTQSEVTSVTNANLRAVIYVGALISSDDDTFYPLPIKDAIGVNSVINSRNVQIADPFLTTQTYIDLNNTRQNTLFLFNPQGALNGNTYELHLTYLSYPPILSTLNIEDIVEYENMYLNKVFEKAKRYAMIDSQEEFMQPQGE